MKSKEEVLERLKKVKELIHSHLTENWKDRHITPLPKEECQMTILTNEGEFTGEWIPLEPENKDKFNKGYLGTVRVKAEIQDIGFHAWEQNNSEFQYYKLHG